MTWTFARNEDEGRTQLERSILSLVPLTHGWTAVFATADGDIETQALAALAVVAERRTPYDVPGRRRTGPEPVTQAMVAVVSGCLGEDAFTYADAFDNFIGVGEPGKALDWARVESNRRLSERNAAREGAKP